MAVAGTGGGAVVAAGAGDGAGAGGGDPPAVGDRSVRAGLGDATGEAERTVAWAALGDAVTCLAELTGEAGRGGAVAAGGAAAPIALVPPAGAPPAGAGAAVSRSPVVPAPVGVVVGPFAAPPDDGGIAWPT